VALGFRTMEQRIDAGSDFDGTQPVGDVSRENRLEAYPSGIIGGLFDLGLEAPVWVRTVELKLGGQTAWTVHKKDAQDDELLVLCGTDETDFLTTLSDSFVLNGKERLVVRTTGATGKLICRVTIQSPV
jgi:hypothetical protein